MFGPLRDESRDGIGSVPFAENGSSSLELKIRCQKRDECSVLVSDDAGVQVIGRRKIVRRKIHREENELKEGEEKLLHVLVETCGGVDSE